VFRTQQTDETDGCWLKNTTATPSADTYIAYKVTSTADYIVWPAKTGEQHLQAAITERLQLHALLHPSPLQQRYNAGRPFVSDAAPARLQHQLHRLLVVSSAGICVRTSNCLLV
jgi:hypothetical protein